MTAADMNARTGQSNDDVIFIKMFLLNRNVVLRFCCGLSNNGANAIFPSAHRVFLAFARMKNGRLSRNKHRASGSSQRNPWPDGAVLRS